MIDIGVGALELPPFLKEVNMEFIIIVIAIAFIVDASRSAKREKAMRHAAWIAKLLEEGKIESKDGKWVWIDQNK